VTNKKLISPNLILDGDKLVAWLQEAIDDPDVFDHERDWLKAHLMAIQSGRFSLPQADMTPESVVAWCPRDGCNADITLEFLKPEYREAIKRAGRLEEQVKELESRVEVAAQLMFLAKDYIPQGACTIDGRLHLRIAEWLAKIREGAGA
jgi:hypothetical protein